MPSPTLIYKCTRTYKGGIAQWIGRRLASLNSCGPGLNPIFIFVMIELIIQFVIHWFVKITEIKDKCESFKA